MTTLWTHQLSALSELADAIAAGETRICLTSPTGGGKSKIMLEHILDNPDLRFQLYTDRRMLLSQLAGNLEDAGIHAGIIAAGHESEQSNVQLCMTQTVVSQYIKGLRNLPSCHQAFNDEAHKMSGASMQAIRDQLGDHVSIGVTATPLGIGHFYDRLIVAGTNSELRACGALVPAYTFGPDEPDTKWIGKVKIDDGECGIPNAKRMQFAQRVFGRVVDNYRQLNPQGVPAILFAPGVRESIWFAEKLTEAGIPSAHIDGENVWLDGEQLSVTQELRDEIRDRLESGKIKVVCNRFVLREGIDWPFVQHGIFATVFGSTTSFLQAGGRLLRAHPGKSRCIIQDHGASWWRFGSLNADREWDLTHNDRIVAGLRAERIRSKKEPEPVVCPKCHGCRLGGPDCPHCGYRHTRKSRPVLQADGTLREMRGDIFRARRIAERTERLEKDWVYRIRAIKRSKKPSVKNMTFAEVEANFARENDWRYPPRDLPLMPIHDADWFRPVREVTEVRDERANVGELLEGVGTKTTQKELEI